MSNPNGTHVIKRGHEFLFAWKLDGARFTPDRFNAWRWVDSPLAAPEIDAELKRIFREVTA